MPRAERLRVPGGHYFVIDEFEGEEVLVARADRAHSEEELRQIAVNRRKYESLLAYAARRWCAIVCLHCWLPDRALLELQMAHAPLEGFMHSLRQPFAHFLHRCPAQGGRAYAGRYRAWLVDPRCAADLRRDILWRPVRRGLCRDPLDYRYTTLNCACDVCSQSPLLSWLSQQRLDTRQRLTDFLRAPSRADFSRVLRGSPRDRRIIGYPEFVSRVQRTQGSSPARAAASRVIPWVAELLQLRADEILRAARDPRADRARALIAWLVTCSGAGSVSGVSSWFEVCERARLQRRIDHFLRSEPQLFSRATVDQFIRSFRPRLDAAPQHLSQGTPSSF